MRWITTLCLLLCVLGAAWGEDVPLTQESGVWKVPVRIDNAVTLQFVVDSGAAEVCVPQDVVTTLVRAGTIHQEDMLEDSTSVLADGSRHRTHRVKLWQVEVGNQVLTDVPAMITPPSGVLLLGQSCLQRLPNWQLDTPHKLLHIGAAAPAPTMRPRPRASPTPKEEAAAPESDDGTGWLWAGIGILLLVGIGLAVMLLRPGNRTPPRDPDDLGL